MKRFSIMGLNTCCALMIYFSQDINSNKGSQQSLISALEKRAKDVQQISVFDLDSNLPKIQLADWVRQQIDSKSGINWQLSDCGGERKGGEIQACSEVNAVLPDKRKVVLMFTIGEFRRGVTSNTKFLYGVIDIDGELYKVSRLRDLPDMLRIDLRNSGETQNQGTPVQLPTLANTHISQVITDSKLINPVILKNEKSTTPIPVPESPPPLSPLFNLVTVADAILKVQPQYPAKARKLNAQGTVKVQVLISAQGKVVETKVLSGNPLFHEAAINAARQWVFRSAVGNDQSMLTQLVLTFDFKVP